ncbi:ribonuclease E activity regulator RraA [Methylococcus sp. EFPC2]|uniref:ribonuclease E activity regulator RraA n=1 Tax=Methylococcus sp. EFPC2 TaxID=2812648 RepID=UPI0019680E58|nr:ribonuclease E activity regulator RraA [Methylococcus sp. EFPC2]QSA98683.1 ribonuclease E activity regulator RraA [Methylococcus sp. EFPC2]
MTFRTADLCDQFSETSRLQIADPLFKAFGSAGSFSGKIVTLKVFEDNVLLRTVLEGRGDGRILVVDGGGSHRCALMGSNLARLATQNGWQGIILYGCIRDSVEIGAIPIGIRALHTHPLRSHKRGAGERDILITFAGVNFRSGHYLYADEDGLIVSEIPLLGESADA